MRLLCIQIRISWWFWIQVQMSAFYLLSTVQQASGHVREMSFLKMPKEENWRLEARVELGSL